MVWRACFFLAGGFILAGGPLHPDGTMAEMLADPKWVPAHVLLTLGFAFLLAGLLLHRRTVPLSAGSRRWARFAIWGSLLQLVEMVLHTAASIDLHHLVAGQPTPVLSTHLGLAIVAYPLFALTTIGWIVTTGRDGSLASPWVGWIGILGALGHGLAPPLFVGLEIEAARVLFRALVLFAVWCVVASLWPARRTAPARPEPSPA